MYPSNITKINPGCQQRGAWLDSIPHNVLSTSGPFLPFFAEELWHKCWSINNKSICFVILSCLVKLHFSLPIRMPQEKGRALYPANEFRARAAVLHPNCPADCRLPLPSTLPRDFSPAAGGRGEGAPEGDRSILLTMVGIAGSPGGK